MTFIIRFVANCGLLIERFVCFVPNVQQKAEKLVNSSWNI